MHQAVIVLNVHPHVLVIFLIHHSALLNDTDKLRNGRFHAALVQNNAGLRHYGREHSWDLGGGTGIADTASVKSEL